MKSEVLNSSISREKVEIYNGVRIVNSIVENNCIIGDFSRLTKSKLNGFNRIDRNTLIYFSELNQASYVGSNSVIMHADIDKFCSISWGVTIGPANHDYNKLTTHDFLYNNFYGLNPTLEPAYNRFSERTKIGNDVWIGTGVTIANGIKIGDGAVIGANTMVTKDVEPYSIIIGNPGRVLKKRFSQEQINQLLELKWWDLPFNIIKENFDLFGQEDISESILKIKEIKKGL